MKKQAVQRLLQRQSYQAAEIASVAKPACKFIVLAHKIYKAHITPTVLRCMLQSSNPGIRILVEHNKWCPICPATSSCNTTYASATSNYVGGNEAVLSEKCRINRTARSAGTQKSRS